VNCNEAILHVGAHGTKDPVTNLKKKLGGSGSQKIERWTDIVEKQ
jgi:hypothetical protein